MKSYKLIHQLISLAEDFENENCSKELSLKDFTGFLVSRLNTVTDEAVDVDVRFGQKAPEAQQRAYQIDNSIARLFVYMSRYAKLYIKKALDDTPLQTAEDFTYLAILNTHEDLSKSELISRNLQEKTSGTEVIRRLITAGLVEQWNHETDKRGKRIAITPKGKELLNNVFKDMNDVSKIISGKLNMSEKLTLYYLLQKLEDFHYDEYQQKSVISKADLKSLSNQIQNN